jgi:ADP-heptose:LPS heptosyltransferase
MYIGIVNKKLIGKGIVFEKDDMYLFNETMKNKFENHFSKVGLKDVVDFLHINEAFDRFERNNSSTVLIIRSGGIGDIIALSSVCNLLYGKKIIFLTNKTYKPVFSWFLNDRIKVVDFNEPLLSGSVTRFVLNSRSIKRVNFDGVIEEGSSKNWYQIFYDSIGISSNELRPALRTYRGTQLPSNIDKSRYSVLICHRASANMRSMSFQNMYTALLETKFSNSNIYVHVGNLSNEDNEFIKLVDDERIKIIKAEGVKEFLLDVFDADMVLSVDTAAIHFREGIQKPAIAFYASFTAECRTLGYKYTKGVNITSTCDLQPCFLHQTVIGQVCPRSEKESVFAPCLDHRVNKSVIEQIVKAINNY